MFKIEQILYIKMDLALNNLQRLICHKTQQTKPNQKALRVAITDSSMLKTFQQQKKKKNNETLARWGYYFHFLKFTCTTQGTA